MSGFVLSLDNDKIAFRNILRRWGRDRGGGRGQAREMDDIGVGN